MDSFPPSPVINHFYCPWYIEWLAADQLPLSHSDPADRFLVATAEVLGLTLVTADERLLGLGEIKTLANR